MFRRPLLAAALVVLAVGDPAWGDSVLLDNGVRLIGTVTDLTEGTLTLQTDFAGAMKIKWSKVATLETERPMRLRLHGDRLVVGRLVSGEKGFVRCMPEGRSELQDIPLSEVVRIDETGVIWSGSLTLSGKVEDGNSVSETLFFSGELSRRSDDTRILTRMHGGFEKKNEVLTEQSFYGLAKFDLNLSPTTYLYVSDELRSDKFEDLRMRDVASLGAGYIFFEEEALTLWVEGGPAYITEELESGDRDSWFGGRVALHVRWHLPMGLEIRDDATYYPNFEDWENYQFHNELSLSTRIGQGWQLTASMLSDWDNEPVPGKKHEDNKYTLGIGYRF